MILVRPMAGLGNRMTVINSCILLSGNNGNVLIKMVWDKNEELNAGFYDLFKPIPRLHLLRSPRLMDYFEYYRRKDNNLHGVKKIKTFLFNTVTASYKFYNNDEVREFAFNEKHWNKGHSRVALKTYCDLYKKTEENNYYYLFRPADEIEERIQKRTSSFNEKTTGVHIRRTDNLISTKHSKDELFIKRMEDLVKEDIACNFFLTTDDASTEKKFKSYFGDKIISPCNRMSDRNSPQGIKDAATDLFCLSRTKRILGSYWSSFSLVASNIHKIPLEIIT